MADSFGAVRARVADAVARGDITRTRRGHRWYLSDTEWRRLTAAELRHLRALVAQGEARFWTAGGYPAGTSIGAYSPTRGGSERGHGCLN